jgi:hypothetical protein
VARRGSLVACRRVAGLKRDPLERAQAWLVTGPLGHLLSALADLAVVLARHGWSRLRRRGPLRRPG